MVKVITSEAKIKELLIRGVEEVIEYEDLEKKLKSGRVLKVKLGIDPTSAKLHLGQSVPLLKLRDFQELGHQIVFIIGDFTGLVGDTSDKSSERPMLDEATIKRHMKSYVEQAAKILDIKKCEIRYNSEWLKKLNYLEISKQANQFSINEFISRENIRRRLDANQRVSLREVLYPLMQAYDSVAIKADVEIGGTDQRFNLLAGRELQRFYGQEPQNILTVPLLEGLDGRKMSSTWGNTINLTDSSRDMFGKIMSLKDELIIKYFVLITRLDLKEIKRLETALQKDANPRDIKMRLAYELVKFYYSEKEAQKEQEYFIKTFSRKELPQEAMEVKLTHYDLLSALIETGLAKSKSEARRVIKQKGVKVNQKVITDLNYLLKSGDILQKGKIFFRKIS